MYTMTTNTLVLAPVALDELSGGAAAMRELNYEDLVKNYVVSV